MIKTRIRQRHQGILSEVTPQYLRNAETHFFGLVKHREQWLDVGKYTFSSTSPLQLSQNIRICEGLIDSYLLHRGYYSQSTTPYPDTKEGVTQNSGEINDTL